MFRTEDLKLELHCSFAKKKIEKIIDWTAGVSITHFTFWYI